MTDLDCNDSMPDSISRSALAGSCLLFLGLLPGCAAPEAETGWGLADGIRPQFFYAADVPDRVRTPLEQAFSAAIDAWGNYGPIEYWVVGADVVAAEELADRFCKRRSVLGNMRLSDCEEHSRQRTEFVEWAARAATIESTGQPFLDAGWNGGVQWGVHLFSSSYPPGWAGLADVPIEDDQTVLLHEYFHAIQNAHIRTLDWEEREALMGPVWWVEGGAEFMAQVTGERLRGEGALPRDTRRPGFTWSATDRIRDKMRRAQEMLAARPELRLAEIEYGPDAMLAYDLGCWAVAWLCHRAGQDALLARFYPRLELQGWEGAFRDTFGMTSEEFYGEFERFLELPLEEQVRILPGGRGGEG